MDSVLFEGIACYFDTLGKTGYLPNIVAEKLIVLDFLNNLTQDLNYNVVASGTQKKIVSELYKCVLKNNCLNNCN